MSDEANHVWLVMGFDFEDHEVLAVLSSETEAIDRARSLAPSPAWPQIEVYRHEIDGPGVDWVEWRVPRLGPPQVATVTFMGSCGYP